MKTPEHASPRWVPVALLVLTLLTVSMLGVAAGVMLDVLPAWAPRLSAPGARDWAVVNKVLPIGSSIVGAVFVTSLFRRYATKGGTYLLVWAIRASTRTRSSDTPPLWPAKPRSTNRDGPTGAALHRSHARSRRPRSVRVPPSLRLAFPSPPAG